VYRKLFTAWRREKDQITLQSLDATFFRETGDYLSSLENIIMKKEVMRLELQLIRKELERARYMVNDLIICRFSKILTSIISNNDSIEISNLLKEEQNVSESIKQFKDSMKMIIPPPNYDKLKLKKEDPTIFKLVRFIKPTPKIVGVDLKMYGPFEIEDLTLLPEKTALSLLDKDLAVEVNWDIK
jgi:DNA replication initiation complex subunit (GINS family)